MAGVANGIHIQAVIELPTLHVSVPLVQQNSTVLLKQMIRVIADIGNVHKSVGDVPVVRRVEADRLILSHG